MSMLKMTKQQAKPPVPLEPPTTPPARLSHHAASVAQRVEQLEIDLNAAKVAWQDELNRRQVQEDLVDNYKRENTHLLNESDKLKSQLMALLTRMSDARDLINKCMTFDPPPKPPTAAQLEKIQVEVEQALKTE